MSYSQEAAVTVLGAGAWGTTIAWLLARQGHSVCLWARRPEFAFQLRKERENRLYLPGVKLPENIRITADVRDALTGQRNIIIAVPSHGMRAVAQQARPFLAPKALVISATKGLERPQGFRMSEVLGQTLGESQPRIVALSGPNLSGEIVAGKPAVSVVASQDQQAAEEAQKLLAHNLFRIYTNSDIIGVELCGAIKNIIAIGAGICDGLGLGSNARAALLTRGMAEMRRLGLRLGARADTFAGLAGIGDLIATCHSPLSRNWNVGFRLGQGERLPKIIESMHTVAEGIFTTFAAKDKAQALGVEMPITEILARVLKEELSPQDAVWELMTRRWRAEEDEG